MRQLLNGNLIIIGGAEDKEGRKEILRKLPLLYENCPYRPSFANMQFKVYV